jgi:hypothetical protein
MTTMMRTKDVARCCASAGKVNSYSSNSRVGSSVGVVKHSRRQSQGQQQRLVGVQALSARCTGGNRRGDRVGARRALQANAAKETPQPRSDGKILLTKAEIPAFIPRDDFLQQLYQWAEISIGQRGRAAYGYAMTVSRLEIDEELKGFQVQIGKETTIEVGMDDLITEKYEFLSRGPDGFPVPKGKVEEIPGKYLEVRKVDQNPTSDAAKQAIKDVISAVMKAFDSYYAFGSVFSHDST